MAVFKPRLPDDRVNLSSEHPIKNMVLLLAGVLLVVVLVVGGAGLALEAALPMLPVSVERSLFSSLHKAFEVGEEAPGGVKGPLSLEEKRREQQSATLRRLLNEVQVGWPDAPYDFRVEIAEFGPQWDDAQVPNAAAFPGGLILVTPALVEGATSENEIAMVLAHELGHFKNRDHLRGLGMGLVLGLFSVALGTTGGAQAVADLVALAGSLVSHRFSREQERAADAFALELLAKRYGHVGGSVAFFERILALDHEPGVAGGEYFSTHPLSQKRIDAMRAQAKERGWSFSPELVPVKWSPRELLESPNQLPAPPSSPQSGDGRSGRE